MSSATEQRYAVYVDTREHPVLHAEGVPARWTTGALSGLVDAACPGEFYVFQVGVRAGGEALDGLALAFPDLCGDAGGIPAAAFRCINLGGTGADGAPLVKRVDVPAETLRVLWIGIQVPDDAQGCYRGTLRVCPANAAPAEIALTLTVAGDVVAEGGDGDARRLSRLRWLDSRIMQDDHAPTAPFTPLRVDAEGIHSLGHTLALAPGGLPRQVFSRFSGSNTHFVEPRPLLADAVRLVAETADGPLAWQAGEVRLTGVAPDAVTWEAVSHADALELICRGRMEFDGFVSLSLTLRADTAVALDDVRLDAPYCADAARYVMGLGRPGGRHAEPIAWQWNPELYQDCLWLGDVNIGAQWRFKGANYHRPLLNIYYPYHPLALPESWGNDGRGGITVTAPGGDRVTLTAYSGARRLAAGETLQFDVDLHLTPCKPLDSARHWRSRYFHSGGDAFRDLDAIEASGANIINIHHANELNPFINYPYHPESIDDLAAYIRQAHARDLRVKVYYTTRELTNHLPELPALFSLDGEVIFPGPADAVRTIIHPHGPHAWLREHLKADYIPAWEAHLTGMGKFDGQLDLAVITTPETRWNNFYLEGLDWLVRHADIDGLYIDDTALDRGSLRRARKILDRRKDGCQIDLHSWNHFNDLARFASCANIYLEIFPYVDRLWFGEGFDYAHTAPDYWLVEMSGIPFGLMSEMLEGGGNRWLGMVYGMTARLPWAGDPDPRPMWQAWDAFGITDARMIGYWDAACPVRTDHPDVPATVYLAPGRALVALGSWADESADVRLTIDWPALGLDPAGAVLYSPAIDNYQPARAWQADDAIPVAPLRGWVVVIEAGGATHTELVEDGTA